MIFIVLGLLILFLIWQFKMFKKYALSVDRFKLDVPARYIMVNKERIIFEEIDFVTVRELEQPSTLEKVFSRSASSVYMAEVSFHLKSGYELACKFNHKGTLYKALKQLQPFVQINANVADYKPQVGWVAILMVLIILGFLLSML